MYFMSDINFTDILPCTDHCIGIFTKTVTDYMNFLMAYSLFNFSNNVQVQQSLHFSNQMTRTEQ